MAELIDFRYQGKTTVLHAIDARVKLAAMAALSITTMTIGPLGMALVSAAVAAGAYFIRHLALRLLMGLKFFWLILLGVVLARALTTPGVLLFKWQFLSVSYPGLAAGFMIAWRLLVIVCLSLLITVSTPANDIRGAVQWYLQPIPFVKGHTISDMVMLVIRFMPVILIRSQQISDAQKARSVSCRRNPLYRMRVYSMSLLRQTILESEQLSYAMASRCYDTHRKSFYRPFRFVDAVLMILLILFCSLLLLI